MHKYFVYSGYIGPDHHDCSEDGPMYKITEFDTEEEVLHYKKVFDESMTDDCSVIIFRVFRGEEKHIIPKKKIVEYKLR